RRHPFQEGRACAGVREAYDAIVGGAGPTGSSAARLLAERGWSVLLVEEHPQVGIPVQCAGLVTPRTFNHTPFPIGDLWQNDLTGGRVHSPDGTAVEFDGKAVHAQAMDRARFDQRMAEHAVRAGVELRTATKAVEARRDPLGVTVAFQGPEGRATARCRLLVGADGIRGSVARWFDFPPVQEIVSCYEAELVGCRIPPDKPHIIPMFAGHDAAPGFFSWIIPVGGDRARAGLAVAPGMNEQSARAYYERMFTDPLSAPYLAGAKPTYLIIGGIPLGLRSQLVQDRVMLVGDAAGMAKPTSGGGIYYGLVASGFLAEVADRGLRTDRLSRGDLLPYERKVRRVLGRELRKGNALRAIYKRFRDADFDRLARLLAKPRPRAVIERVGDIDYPSRLVLPLLWAEPRLAPFFLRVLLRPGAP
ncbi:MAG TPA: NAD(P)/FAD-dependent oxidoreductase, partial [Candidatus Thermoplasmatota archaeon]|nr:NAD(P)/FAD-dependent oxidoreductase [Candidatus Thermoplasmatota archaeon]